jgi:transposase-like protein
MCLEKLRQNPYILFIDCTYETNYYNIPLLNIVSVNAMNSTFYVGFGFIQEETEESYKFLLTCLNTIYKKLNLPSLNTILMDKDQALINAIKDILPVTNHMLCIWHINKNITARAKPLIQSTMLCIIDDDEFKMAVDDTQSLMLKEWMTVVNAETEPQMRAVWESFKKTYNNDKYREVMRYITDEWLEPVTAHRFLHCYTNIYLHFNNAATSRYEAAY